MTAVIQVSKQIKASAERAFDAWLDTSKVGYFLFATPKGQMQRIEIDPRVGGTFTIIEKRDNQNIVHTGQYVTLERPVKLAFTFEVPQFSKEQTKVTVDFLPMENDTQITLTHEGVLPEYTAKTEAGWLAILEGLNRLLDEN